jgi:hypothetical protein
VLCMLCLLTRTGKPDLHLGVARLEQRRKQHEVIILAPNHVPLLVVIKHSLQQSDVMLNLLLHMPLHAFSVALNTLALLPMW